MQQLAQRATTLTPSLTLAIDAKAKKLKAEGVDVCGFGAGEPDFDTPQYIKDAAAQALAAGFTKYTPSSGIPELRAAIAEKLKNDNGLDYKPSQIIVNCGAKHSCYNVILATCQAGDEVIIPAPYWLSYPEMAKLADASPVIVETTEASGFKITPEQFREAMTPATKLIILNSPGNPTGSVYSREELHAEGADRQALDPDAVGGDRREHHLVALGIGDPLGGQLRVDRGQDRRRVLGCGERRPRADLVREAHDPTFVGITTSCPFAMSNSGE